MFIPIYDGKPLVNIRRPFVNLALIAANLIAFIGLQLPQGTGNVALSLGLIPALINHYAVLPEAAIWVPAEVSLLSYAFLHSSLLHLGGNMVFLWVFGDNVEDAMGHVKYLIFYLASAFCAGLLHVAVFPDATAPLIGASGAVAGVVAAYLMLHPRMRVWVLAFGKIPLPITARWCLGAWISLQVFQFLFAADSTVSWSAHVGGIIAGGILVVFLKHRHTLLFDRALSARLTDQESSKS
ncbi:MAG: rhomboid family intramembrane serine protease [Rhizobiales bacterium]|nr:rhomboid family intramembrane serine protease [Hyphomicrobiales bacterium]